MDKFLIASKALHHMVITPTKVLFAEERYLTPMSAIYDERGNVRMHKTYGFVMTKPMSYSDRLDKMVTKWITPNNVMQELSFTDKNIVNKVKEFVNTNASAVFLHSTSSDPSRFCNFRKPSHFHVVTQSMVPCARDLPKFRTLETVLRGSDTELFCKKVTSTPQDLFAYLVRDPEKTFLGTNNDCMLRIIREMSSTNHPTIEPELAGTPPAPQLVGPSTSTTTAKRKLVLDDTESVDEPPAKRSKNLIMLDNLKETLKVYPYCATFSDLVAAVRGTARYDTICNAYLDHRAEKLWALARDDMAPPDQDIDLLDMIRQLPDDLPNTMTVEMTLALFNSWCSEQSINAKHLAWFIISRLQGRVYKKIGLYFQGASNSGKTYWSTLLFSALSSIVGKMSTGGRFCLQDCERKRIVIGEEVGITLDNVDRIKELMSGDVTTCERKGRSVVKCKASLVLLNSNNMPASNVPQERQALLNRMLLIRNLKPSSVLPTALKYTKLTKPNLKFLLLVPPPTEAELRNMEMNILPEQELLEHNNRILLFNDSWESFAEDAVNGLGTEAPTETPDIFYTCEEEPPQRILSSPLLEILTQTPRTDVSPELSYTSESTDCALVFDTLNHYILSDFGYCGDMGVIHKDADEHTGTLITYTATILHYENVHLLTVKVPTMHKGDQRILDIDLNVTKLLHVDVDSDNTYVRTKRGMESIPQQPCSTIMDFNDDDTYHLQNLFIMLVNHGKPTDPIYKLFLDDDTVRPNNMNLWPTAPQFRVVDVNKARDDAIKKLTLWLSAHQKSSSSNQNNNADDTDDDNNQDDVDACFQFLFKPKKNVISFCESVVKGCKCVLKMTNLFLHILKYPHAKVYTE
ncbi:hypothetical protein ElyMa_000468000 [Elysia marginata]|uniref:NrS-1 polymerase-like helicase domain-containing protein n=1 Tax=Elysia marginata TaxID=1093978 RepID=A0AAV4FR56_9GAST|nr:hypothetical protein ElyMa_000468000 [Elysia marginata]